MCIRDRPWGVGGRGDAIVGTLVFYERDEQAGKRLGDVDTDGADLEEDVFVGDVHLVPGEDGNPGHLLAVEQDEASGDAVSDLEGVVMEKPVSESPAGVLVHCGAGT